MLLGSPEWGQAAGKLLAGLGTEFESFRVSRNKINLRVMRLSVAGLLRMGWCCPVWPRQMDFAFLGTEHTGSLVERAAGFDWPRRSGSRHSSFCAL